MNIGNLNIFLTPAPSRLFSKIRAVQSQAALKQHRFNRGNPKLHPHRLSKEGFPTVFRSDHYPKSIFFRAVYFGSKFANYFENNERVSLNTDTIFLGSDGT